MSRISEVHENNLDFTNRTIYLHGNNPIGEGANEEPGVDYRMAARFIKNIDMLTSDKTKVDDGNYNISYKGSEPIIIIMSTFGGDWNYGMAIYDAIKACKSHTTIIAYSWARSMSSIILQAADHRVMMPHADFMIHMGDMVYNGNYTAVKSDIEHEVLSENVMLDIYTEKCVEGQFFEEQGMSVIEVKDYLIEKMAKKVDWWLTAKKAVYCGFADEVYGDNI